MILVHNRKYNGLSFAERYKIVVTPATKVTGMWWWKKKKLGWAIVQSEPFYGDICSMERWTVIFWTDCEEEAKRYKKYFEEGT